MPVSTEKQWETSGVLLCPDGTTYTKAEYKGIPSFIRCAKGLQPVTIVGTYSNPFPSELSRDCFVLQDARKHGAD